MKSAFLLSLSLYTLFSNASLFNEPRQVDSSTVPTTTSSSISASFTGYTIPTEDDPEEDGDVVNPNDLKRRRISERHLIRLNKRRNPITSFGGCDVPAMYGKINPREPPKVTAQLPAGILGFFDRDVTATGVDLIQRPNILATQTLKDYSMDHLWEVKFLRAFLTTILPAEAGSAPNPNNKFTDCNNFNQVFFPAAANPPMAGVCNNNMDKLYQYAASNSDQAPMGQNNQLEFGAMLKDLNNKKGIIMKPGEFVNQKWLDRNLPSPGGAVTTETSIGNGIVLLQNVAIAMKICKDTGVVQLFDRTNNRIYSAFQAIDTMVTAKSIVLGDTNFRFATEYESYMSTFLAKQAGDTWQFIDTTMTTVQNWINTLAPSAAQTTFQTDLDNFKNGDFGKESFYAFSFATSLSGSTAITFKRDLFDRDGSCPLATSSSSIISTSSTRSASRSGSATSSASLTASTGSATRSGTASVISSSSMLTRSVSTGGVTSSGSATLSRPASTSSGITNSAPQTSSSVTSGIPSSSATVASSSAVSPSSSGTSTAKSSSSVISSPAASFSMTSQTSAISSLTKVSSTTTQASSTMTSQVPSTTTTPKATSTTPTKASSTPVDPTTPAKTTPAKTTPAKTTPTKSCKKGKICL